MRGTSDHDGRYEHHTRRIGSGEMHTGTLGLVAGEFTRTQGISRTVRLIADLLQGIRHTRSSAAELLGLQRAAAARQLEAIAKHLPGVHVSDTPRGKQYWMPRSPTTSPVVSLGSAIGACFGASLAPLFEGTRFAIDMREETKRTVNRAARAREFGDFSRKFMFHARGGEVAMADGGAMLADVVEAVLRSQWTRLTYTRFEASVDKIDIRPLSLVVYEHQLYVVGLDSDDKLHPYRFARISAVAPSTQTFQYPAPTAYDPYQLFRHSLGVFVDPRMSVINVCVRLAPRWRTYAETHRWHPSQRHTVSVDGAVQVQLTVRECPELDRWVLGFGADALVLEPLSLRHRIRAALASAAAAYQ